MNPLLESFNTPFETPPFTLISAEDYLPAFQSAIERGRDEINALIADEGKPDFTNTIEKLAYSGQLLDRISAVFFNLNHAETNSRMQEIAREVSPLLTDFHNDILFNEELFGKVKQVYENKEKYSLNTEQSKLLEDTFKGFARNGAHLNAEKKEKLRAISRELSQLTLKFNDNVLADTHNWFLHLTSKDDLEGLPESLIDSAADIAKEKELQGWVITLDAPLYMPFMKYSAKRELRQKIHKAFNTRGYRDNEYNNTDTLLRIVNLRLQKAQLLGYESYADFKLEESMAQSSKTVNEFLARLADAALPAGRKELGEVKEFASEKGFSEELQAYDWPYYAEQLRKEKFEFDEELTRPYFELERVVQGVFQLSEKLWGLRYKENKEVQVYHPDVRVYEVYDENDTFLSILYLDFFPRAGKSSGAWMTSFREQFRENGTDFRPQVSLVCNFTKPTDKNPSLLTFTEFTTFLHEFGHALHGMFSQVQYPSLSGTNVYRDFVELPSQLLENWAVEKDFLNLFALHYQTGEAMPEEMVEKIIRLRNFHAGYATARQLGFGITDMAWHSITETYEGTAEEMEHAAMSRVQMFPFVEGTLFSPSFGHLFAGGYAAGYYGYKWAEVLDADAFEAFKEKGIFCRETAASFRDNILAKGGTEHPMDLYMAFRGQKPDIKPLLKRDGLLTE